MITTFQPANSTLWRQKPQRFLPPGQVTQQSSTITFSGNPKPQGLDGILKFSTPREHQVLQLNALFQDLLAELCNGTIKVNPYAPGLPDVCYAEMYIRGKHYTLSTFRGERDLEESRRQEANKEKRTFRLKGGYGNIRTGLLRKQPCTKSIQFTELERYDSDATFWYYVPNKKANYLIASAKATEVAPLATLFFSALDDLAKGKNPEEVYTEVRNSLASSEFALIQLPKALHRLEY